MALEDEILGSQIKSHEGEGLGTHSSYLLEIRERLIPSETLGTYVSMNLSTGLRSYTEIISGRPLFRHDGLKRTDVAVSGLGVGGVSFRR
jgi:hypothetical protein